MNIHAIDIGHELRHGIQPRFDLRQSCSVSIAASFRMVAIGTPCDVSLTVRRQASSWRRFVDRSARRLIGSVKEWNALIAVSGAVADVAMNTLRYMINFPHSRIEPLNHCWMSESKQSRSTGPPSGKPSTGDRPSLSKREAESFGAVVEELDLKPSGNGLDWPGGPVDTSAGARGCHSRRHRHQPRGPSPRFRRRGALET